MAQETYDWSADYVDEQSGGTTTFTSTTGETVDVSVAQPDPGGFYRFGRDGFETNTQGGFAGGHFEAGLNFTNNSQTVTQTIDFSNNTQSGANSVTDVSFTLFDIDSTTTGTFQDQVTVLAFDAMGNPLTVTLTAINGGVVSISGATATSILGAGSSTQGSTAATSTDGNVTVNIAGEVASIQIIYGNGPGAQANPNNQAIGIGDLSFDLIPAAPCFLRGTRILTPRGEVAVEALSAGDLVMTADQGAQPLRWIASSKVVGRAKLAPVRFAKGAIGNVRALTVSPQHKVVVTGSTSELLTGEREVLVAAIELVNGRDVTRTEAGEIEYFHLMFARHQIIFAEGAPCESLFIGRQGLRWMSSEALRELEAIFPGLLKNPDIFGPAARRCLKAHEAQLVA